MAPPRAPAPDTADRTASVPQTGALAAGRPADAGAAPNGGQPARSPSAASQTGTASDRLQPRPTSNARREAREAAALRENLKRRKVGAPTLPRADEGDR